MQLLHMLCVCVRERVYSVCVYYVCVEYESCGARNNATIALSAQWMDDRKNGKERRRESKREAEREKEKEREIYFIFICSFSLSLFLTLLSQLVFIAAAYGLVRIKFRSLSGCSMGYSLHSPD